MDFVLALHSHLPYVLNHGRWPHGSDWLCEAALDTYLPLLDKLEELAGAGIPAPVSIGFTPVLANQLADPAFGEAEQAGVAYEEIATVADFIPLVGENYVGVRHAGPAEAESFEDYSDLVVGIDQLLKAGDGRPLVGLHCQ